jgi:hypothetical protein
VPVKDTPERSLYDFSLLPRLLTASAR